MVIGEVGCERHEHFGSLDSLRNFANLFGNFANISGDPLVEVSVTVAEPKISRFCLSVCLFVSSLILGHHFFISL